MAMVMAAGGSDTGTLEMYVGHWRVGVLRGRRDPNVSDLFVLSNFVPHLVSIAIVSPGVGMVTLAIVIGRRGCG